jgi:hypothetical protein
MKAKIYGHELEGAPEEILAFKEHLDDQIAKLTKNKPKPYTYEYYNPVYIGTPVEYKPDWNTVVTCKTTYITNNSSIESLSNKIIDRLSKKGISNVTQ